MIIQAGFDFAMLAQPYIIQCGRILPRLVIISVDSEMELDYVQVVAEDFAGSLEPFYDAVLAALDQEDTKYFAIAHSGRFSASYHMEPLVHEARFLESKASERGMQLIGHIAIDESGFMSARAFSYFDQYPTLSNLPRTMLQWSHSTLSSCSPKSR